MHQFYYKQHLNIHIQYFHHVLNRKVYVQSISVLEELVDGLTKMVNSHPILVLDLVILYFEICVDILLLILLIKVFFLHVIYDIEIICNVGFIFQISLFISFYNQNKNACITYPPTLFPTKCNFIVHCSCSGIITSFMNVIT